MRTRTEGKVTDGPPIEFPKVQPTPTVEVHIIWNRENGSLQVNGPPDMMLQLGLMEFAKAFIFQKIAGASQAGGGHILRPF